MPGDGHRERLCFATAAKEPRRVPRPHPRSPRPKRVTDAAYDADLLLRVAAGDRGAPLEELYDRYHRRVWAVGLRRLGDRAAAEDLVRETFVRLSRAAGRFDPERGTVGAFLMTIAHRAAADLGRRPGEAPVVSLNPEEPELLRRDELQAAIWTLPPDHREILRLHFREDLTQGDIARRLDLPIGTVRARVLDGLRQLRAAASEHGQQPHPA